MSTTSENNKRIAKNTVLLYIRMLITLVVSLYTSRVVLNTLGVDDYGVYSVVGGIVVILGFLNGAMASATQRYLNFELGKNDFQRLQKVFSTSLIIHVLVAVAVLIIAETIGLWYLNTFMNIAENRMTAANWVYQFSVAAFLVNILSVPYNATIIAHEKMSAFAYISIFEVFLRLVIVYLLVLSPFDKLIFYAFLIFLVGVIIRIIYGIYCKRHFAECTVKWVNVDKPLMKDMMSFSSWVIIGNLSFIVHTQGIALVLNAFFGVVLNAASGIANQVNGAVQSFISNFLTAMNPQIVKTYASEEYNEMHKLLIRGCQLAFYMAAFFVIPLAIEAPIILKVWLKIVPDYTIIFVRLVLLITLLNSFSGILATAKGATGNIKKYQITLTSIGIAHLPLAIIAFYLGYPPQSAMYIYLTLIIIMQVVRIWFVCRSIGLGLSRFYREVVLRCLLVLILSAPIPILLHNIFISSFATAFGNCVIACCCVSVSALYCGFNRKDRKRIQQIIMTKLSLKK